MEPDPHVDPELANRVPDRLGATNRTRGAVERGEEPVAGSVDLPASKPVELMSNRCMVAFHHVTPGSVPERGSLLCRADDVGEHHRSEHAIGLRRFSDAGEELLDFVEESLAVTDEVEVVAPG